MTRAGLSEIKDRGDSRGRTETGAGGKTAHRGEGRRWSRYRRDMIHGARITTASMAAYLLVYLLGLPEGLWAVITAVAVVQSSIGGSLKVAFEQFIGSLFGAIYATAVVLLMAPSDFPTGMATLILALAPLSLLAARSASFRIAPITAVIMFLGGPGLGLGPLDLATSRILEVSLGCGAGLLVSLLVAPARASRAVLEQTAAVARLMARQLETLAARRAGQADSGFLAGRIRKEVTQLENLVEEAARERRIWLTDIPDVEPLARTMRRLRHDIGMLRRTPREAGDSEAAQQAAEPLRQALEAGAATLQQIDQVLAGDDVAADLKRLAGAVRAYRKALDDMRQARVTRRFSTAALGRLFGVGFALDQFRRDLEDLVARCEEIAAARRARAHLLPRALTRRTAR